MSAYAQLRLRYGVAIFAVFLPSFCRPFAVFFSSRFRVVFESFSRCISNRLLMECTKTVDYWQRDRGGIARNREGDREGNREADRERTERERRKNGEGTGRERGLLHKTTL